MALLGPIPTVLNIDLCTTRSVYVNIFWHCWDQSQQGKIFTHAQLGSVHTYISWHCWDIPNSIKLYFGCKIYCLLLCWDCYCYVICATWECERIFINIVGILSWQKLTQIEDHDSCTLHKCEVMHLNLGDATVLWKQSKSNGINGTE